MGNRRDHRDGCPMFPDLLLNIICTFAVVAGTLLVGAPLVFGLIRSARPMTKFILSFAAGYSLLSLAGILAGVLGAAPWMGELPVLLAGAALSLRYRGFFTRDFDRLDLAVGCLSVIYIGIGLVFFSAITMWMAGDAVAHASIIRMLLDGGEVPVSLYPFGNYWDYYPKGFHFFAAFWGGVFPVLNLVQTIPVLVTAVTPVLVYSVVRELGRREVAVFAFIFAGFCFPAHYMYLIWAGYPSATAEMLLVAAVLAVVVERRLLPLLVLGMAFTHTRYLAYLAVIFAVWLGIEYLRDHAAALKRYLLALPLLLAAAVAVVVLFVPVQEPGFLLSLAGSKALAAEYVAQWFWALLSVFGFVVAFYNRDRLDRLCIAWTVAIAGMLVFSDIGVLDFVATPNRVLTQLYIPFSIFGAAALAAMAAALPKARPVFALVLAVAGAAAMAVVLFTYAGAWALPPEDSAAIEWLSEQNTTNMVCINLDETGAWVYPIAGVPVARPRLVPGDTPYDYKTIQRMVLDPNSAKTLAALREVEDVPTVIYVSNVSLSRPGYVPPFSGYSSVYPKINPDFDAAIYETIYGNGAKIYKFRAEAGD
ncbi:hypothetical protein DSECCO2_19170 [anaerobic digester metagenome]